jgi:Methyltransferase domain
MNASPALAVRPGGGGLLMQRWADCYEYLEAHCNPYEGPFPSETALYAQVLWLLAECCDAKAILEIGVGPTSVSGCVWIHSMGGRGGGQLFSVDKDTTLPQAQFRELAKACGVNWKVAYGDSLTLTGEWPGLQVDLLYVDGDHDEAHAYGDTLGYLPYLRPGGYLLIDDYPAFQGVYHAAERLRGEGYKFIHVPHHPPDGNGRLVWQKPS